MSEGERERERAIEGGREGERGKEGRRDRVRDGGRERTMQKKGYMQKSASTLSRTKRVREQVSRWR